MKVLIAHNFYRSSAPSGEDVVYRNERALMEREIDVIPYERFNDDIDDSTLGRKIGLAFNSAWSRQTYNELSAVIQKNRPDVAHFHNTFPQISPSAYAACRDNGVPVVQTLHNFRLICPGGLLLRDGRPCEDCVGTNLLPALQHRCYRGSLPATGALVWMLARNRWHGTYTSLVHRYIALTEFAAGRLIAGGLPRDRMSVKPNFVPSISEPGSGGGGYAIYVGRLSAEKGLRTLISAWKLLQQIPLKILGDGPLRQELVDLTVQNKLSVEFLGFCDRPTIIDTIGGAVLQVVPSECYEGFPMVVLEAYACGTPVVCSRIGSLNEIVEEGVTGVKFDPGNPLDLAAKIQMLWDDSEGLKSMRETVRMTFDNNFSAEKNFEVLMEIYEMTIRSHAQPTR